MGAGDELLAYYEEQAYEECEDSPGSIMSFNIDYGYLEGICRGFRSGFLRDFHYRQLCQCENMDDVKLTLSDTDFVGVMAELTKLTPEGIMARCRTKLVDEVDHLRSQAVGSLSTFLDYISYEYMINNVSFLIISLIKGANPQALLAKCDPLGKFPYMQSILTFENTQDGLIQLYRSFLVDTPVARYFERYFLEAAAGQGGLEHVSQIFHEEDIEVINDRLKKLWLEDFYRFTQALGGETATVMDRLLSWEADQRAIAIMINSFGTPLNESAQRPDRQRMFASFGRLYPNAIMAFENCDNMQSLGVILEKYPEYYEIFDRAQAEELEIEDLLLAKEVAVNREGFDGQGHFGCFWSLFKLREQEKRNIYWITECINQNLKGGNEINRWISIFP